MRKCVIIGSGLGGLSCGVILAKNGYEVTVLEQSAQIGGCLQCFYRDNVTFDTGMHYIGSADEGQTLNIIMNYLGISSDIELSRLDPMGYDVISYLGEHYRFANGRENFINALAEHFPENRDEIAKYYDLMKLVSSSSAMHSLNKDVDIDINAEYKMKSVNEVLDSIITGSDKAFRLRQVLAGMQPLYAGIKDHTPFSVHALIHDCFNQSAFRIVGGSSKVAASLAKSIQQKGGKVLPNQRVTKIECSDSSSPQATAVITSSGDRYPADLVISAIHPASTMRMTDSRFIRPYFLKRLEKAPNTPSVFVVYLKFKKNRVRYMNHNLYYYRGDTTWGCEQYDDFCPWHKSYKTLSNCLSPQTTDSRLWRESYKTLSNCLSPQTTDNSWPKFLLYMHFCHASHKEMITANAEYAESGKILSYMNYADVKPWEGTHVGQRGDSYEEFKRRKAEQLIDALAEEIPDIRQNIESYYTSTPLTYLDYTGIPEGAMYGMAKDISAIGVKNVSCKTSIPNLLLTGQSITSHGMFGVLAGSLITCSEVLTQEEILKQLRNER